LRSTSVSEPKAEREPLPNLAIQQRFKSRGFCSITFMVNICLKIHFLSCTTKASRRRTRWVTWVGSHLVHRLRFHLSVIYFEAFLLKYNTYICKIWESIPTKSQSCQYSVPHCFTIPQIVSKTPVRLKTPVPKSQICTEK